VTALQVQVGSTITNGSSALRITERGTAQGGWYGITISFLGVGDVKRPQSPAFVPDDLLPAWRHVPFEWTPVVGSGLEERYVWGAGCRWLQREVRKVEPVPVDCRAEHVAVFLSAMIRPLED